MASPPLCIVSQYIAPIQGVKRVVELDGKFSNRAKAWRASKPCKQEKVEKVYSHESGYPPKKNNDAIAPREEDKADKAGTAYPDNEVYRGVCSNHICETCIDITEKKLTNSSR